MNFSALKPSLVSAFVPSKSDLADNSEAIVDGSQAEAPAPKGPFAVYVTSFVIGFVMGLMICMAVNAAPV